MAAAPSHAPAVPAQPSRLFWPAIIVALVFPTFMSWVETRWILPSAADEQAPPALELFFVGKVLQFSLPLLVVICSEPGLICVPGLSRRGFAAGIYFALAGAVGVCALYFGFLRGTPLLAAIGPQMHVWLDKFGLHSLGGFVTFAFIIAVPHSLLEEYYWRWFVFGWLRRRLSFLPAALISGLGFMSHHVLVLDYYLPGYFWIASVPLALTVAVGGFFWAWQYERYRNFYAVWFSHLLVDAVILAVGWDMMNR